MCDKPDQAARYYNLSRFPYGISLVRKHINRGLVLPLLRSEHASYAVLINLCYAGTPALAHVLRNPRSPQSVAVR
jgi:hypothetical protein